MNPKLTKLKLFLCVLGAVIILPLTLTAAYKEVNNTVESESNVSYAQDDQHPALYVHESNARYTGSNIVLTSTGTGGVRDNVNAIYVNNQAEVALYSGTVNATLVGSVGGWPPGWPIFITNTSTALFENMTFNITGTQGGGVGIIYSEASVLTLVSSTVSVTSDSASSVSGVTSMGGARFNMNDSHVEITTASLAARGILASLASTLNNSTIITHSDGTSEALVVTGGLTTGSNLLLMTTGNRVTDGNGPAAVLAHASGTVILWDSTIRTTGTGADGVLTSGSADIGGRVELHNTDIHTSGPNADGIRLECNEGTAGGEKTITIDGGSITAAQGNGISINVQPSGSNTFNPSGSAGINVHYDVTITGSATVTGTAALLVHSIYTDADGNLLDKHTNATVSVNDSALLGDVRTGHTSTTTLILDNHSIIAGDLVASDNATLTVNATDSALAGDVTGSGSATLDLTLSGSAGILLGDIAQNDDAAVTITITDSATGQGGYHGGNLITGGDSTWTFTKDSHGNYGENNGVWNIGDYDVTFDDMTNDGIINISVNNDTGSGGSLIITDTADGEGTVHIDTTGNGKADPNQVLPGKVTGDGTEHWQWDPIDWGIDTIIKDGDHFVKSGVSPAGAVLNSSVAIQQAMWFAQQNSLLKRMGELRYGARASRPLADKDVRVPYNSLIENIWLRSYGQQLNVGSQVAGKAYEQLIYGVDLGTDHKFTISADSDLYLGVYAGYGRSDLDYRTPGADGEINSYYGGLYATWLHSSGFYIDATVKAASVDNDLKAPYSGSQITTKYSDVNIGGSIEIGNKFTFTDGWFVEPQFQVNYLHILAENYTAGPLTISAQDLDALQLRIGSLFGRTINLTNSGALQPYIKISGVETISSGGTLRNGYQHTRANTDGARAELGAGLIWQLDTNNQLHLDYEASFGDKYDKPWGLTAGYRHQF